MSPLAPRFRSAAWLVLIVLCCVGFTGCVNETHDGDKTTFSMQWWGPLTLMLVSLIAGPAGFFLREMSTRLGFGLMIACPFGFLLGISLFTDYCEVDPNGFKGRMGFFGSKTYEGKYADITDISLVTRRSRRSSSVYLIYHSRDGKQHEFSLGNQLTERAAPLILGFAKDKGIPISDQM
jgi:hypothetical protein